MKFLVPNYSCLQNPCQGGYRPPDPRSLCPLSSTEFVETPHPPKKIPVYATGSCHCPAVLLADAMLCTCGCIISCLSSPCYGSLGYAF